MDRENLELIPQFHTRDRQIEASAMMLLAELQQENTGSSLYVESLANLLAIARDSSRKLRHRTALGRKNCDTHSRVAERERIAKDDTSTRVKPHYPK